MKPGQAMVSMSTSDLHDLDLTQLAGQLRTRKVSANELARHFLARAASHDALGVYLARDESVTLAQADAADKRLGRSTSPRRRSGR